MINFGFFNLLKLGCFKYCHIFLPVLPVLYQKFPSACVSKNVQTAQFVTQLTKFHFRKMLKRLFRVVSLCYEPVSVSETTFCPFLLTNYTICIKNFKHLNTQKQNFVTFCLYMLVQRSCICQYMLTKFTFTYVLFIHAFSEEKY